MDIKEIALKVGLQVFEEHPYADGHVVSPSGYTWIDDKLIEFAEALISAYKAELLKEVGEPVAYMTTDEEGSASMLFFDRAEALKYSGDDEPVKLFTESQLLAAAIAKATNPLEDQLAKAEQLWQVAQGRCDGLEEKLAKAEQRVAEAIHDMTDEVCATLQKDDKSNDYWHGVGAAAVAIEKAIRSGEWRKFVKEV